MNDVCDRWKLQAELENDEGRRKRGYLCPAGKWTVGVGHNIEGKDLSERAINVIFEDDIADVVRDLDALWPEWRTLTENRKRALLNWGFQLGYIGMRRFVKFWAAIKAHDYGTAGVELKDSAWWSQTQPSRRERVVNQIVNG